LRENLSVAVITIYLSQQNRFSSKKRNNFKVAKIAKRKKKD
jgi:hypothetical protein